VRQSTINLQIARLTCNMATPSWPNGHSRTICVFDHVRVVDVKHLSCSCGVKCAEQMYQVALH
jgi:hypothetical protein